MSEFDKWFSALSEKEQKEFVEEMEADSYLSSMEAHEEGMDLNY